jgi:hypothetical protein
MKTMTVTIPRHLGWRVIWAVFVVTVEAYLTSDQSITFEVGE